MNNEDVTLLMCVHEWFLATAWIQFPGFSDNLAVHAVSGLTQVFDCIDAYLCS